MSPWNKLVEALGDETLEEYSDSQVLYDQRDEIYYRIEAITKTKTTEEWLDIMLAFDLWVSRVNRQEDVPADEQVLFNNTFIEIEHPKAGKIKVTNIPFTMSETPGTIQRSSPLLGEHGPEILREIGYSEEEISILKKNQILTVEKLAENE